MWQCDNDVDDEGDGEVMVRVVSSDDGDDYKLKVSDGAS